MVEIRRRAKYRKISCFNSERAGGEREIAPNSASCERVFSLLKQMFGLDQKTALADYLQAALMLRFNKRVARG